MNFSLNTLWLKFLFFFNEWSLEVSEFLIKNSHFHFYSFIAHNLMRPTILQYSFK